jgi:formylglycine-generating enzyme required for sulfatase activity
VDLERDDAVMLISDIYAGPGLEGIPRGEVKKLRVYSFTYGYPGIGGLYGSIGMDGPWDMRRVLGTAPVAPDGSAVVSIPANTPIAIQPLDAEGKALQLMRSWFTAMPGETLSCVGCHERPNDAPSLVSTSNLQRAPDLLDPWYGPPRNYEFVREVQPVLDRHCVGCHNGDEPSPDLRGEVMVKGWSTAMPGNIGARAGGKFSVAYAGLHRFVRRPGIESPMPMQVPMEFHADTTELVQLLLKKHHGVKLDEEAWDRLITWIDFNAPYHGRWSTLEGESARVKEAQRAALRKCYANRDENHEELPEPPPGPVEPLMPDPLPPRPPVLVLDGWPFDAETARRMQNGAGVKTLALGNGVTMELVYVPPGVYPMGSVTGYEDEFPMTRVDIRKGFWMGKTEVTNQQFKEYNPSHDSREEDRHGYQFGIPGYDVSASERPAVRLSWREAVAFCDWLSARAGQPVRLPTEAEWEWACRAGTATPFYYGDLNTDFSPYANLGDAMLADFSGNPYKLDPQKARYNNPENPFDNWIPQDARFNDGGFVSEPVGGYRPNAWGLHDMHGNVAEWTASPYRSMGLDAQESKKRVVRGGSWYDRPKRSTSSYRFGYREYQKVYHVGFRIVMAD